MDLMNLNDLVAAIQSREDLVSFIYALLRSLDQESWENDDLPSFLEALARWTNDMDGFYQNMLGEPAPEQPTWDTFGQMLLAATMYE